MLRPPPSLNASEIAHFARLSAQWWNPTGELGMLHRMNPLRVSYVREKLVQAARDDGDEHAADVMVDSARPFRGMDMLDAGCGGGLLSESLARLGARTLGVDLAKENIAIAQTHASRDPGFAGFDLLSYEHTSIESLLERGRAFDLVCLMEVIEHVDNPAQFLKTCASLVKARVYSMHWPSCTKYEPVSQPGGHLFLSTLPRNALSYFLTIFMAERVLGLVSPGTHTHSKYINSSELVDFFRADLGWISALYDGHPPRTEAESRGMAYMPLTGEWTFMPRWAPASSYTNYMFWARRPRQ
ncbi:3-demethylubiquinone-9 3-methyltransferase [Auricularia subglabra TFB-10046 SS5]|nr:3-demethylubiquinone-9 3-methyltransferase [Auricularia subglabra TFB-10046 SS5]